jgi:hypothetical protein
MNKIVVLGVILMMALAITPGILAVEPEETYNQTHNQTPGIGTFVTINQGEGHEPWIKCKWETILPPYVENETGNEILDHYLDDDMVAAGIQINPVLMGTKTVYYYALVTDYEGVGGVQHVYVDVYHPDGQFKYQFELMNQLDTQTSLTIFDEVYENNPTIMEFSDLNPYGYFTNYTEARDEIQQGEAYIWWGQADLSYCQPAGSYEVRTTAVDIGNLWATDLINYFWYVPTIGVLYDFINVTYGEALVDVEKTCGGDYQMTTPDQPTVRNIGNVPIKFNITQDDMGFGMTGSEWNVMFGARLGNKLDGTQINYDPFELAYLPDILPLCTIEKMDFMITVFKAPLEQYSGSLTIGAEMDGDPASSPYATPSQFIGP